MSASHLVGRIVALLLLSVLVHAELPSGCLVTAEKTVGSGAAFSMLVFGDSVLWGNGLAETNDQAPGHKFSELVAQWIAANMNVQVYRKVFGHSAALVLPSVPDSGKRWPGDVNNAYALIPEQAQCPPESEKAATRLVLIDGCINDVGAFQIVNPANNKAWVQKHTNASCGAPVYSMLSSVAHSYPKATILVTGYYPIVSELSDIEQFLDFLRQFFPEEVKRLQLKQGRTQISAAKRSRTTSAENSKLFYELSNTLIAAAVDRINSEIGSTRLYFVKIPFAPENAFGAPHSYLWPIPTVFSGFDEVYLKRQLPCLEAFPLDPAGFEACRVDPTAHPNVAGAQVYANEIIKILQSAQLGPSSR